jgi:hypothetical protein
LERSGGFSSSEVNRLEKLIAEHVEELVNHWNEFFSR